MIGYATLFIDPSVPNVITIALGASEGMVCIVVLDSHQPRGIVRSGRLDTNPVPRRLSATAFCVVVLDNCHPRDISRPGGLDTN
jgi:hypothetical protein